MCKQIVNEFKIDLQNRYAALEEQQDDSNNSISLNDMNNNITEPLIGAGKKWKSSTKRNSKFSEETKNFMEKRRNLKTPTTAKEKIEATERNKDNNSNIILQSTGTCKYFNKTSTCFINMTSSDHIWKTIKRIYVY